MKRSLWAYFIVLMILITGCASSQPAQEPAPPLKTVTLDNTVKIVTGQTVYVPVYSEIPMWEQRRTMNLTVTLSVRNTDSTHPLIVASVNYYDDRGKLIRQYLDQPVELNPLASTYFVIDQDDRSGGIGSSFMVEWVAQQPLSTPVIESIMINTSGNQGISFVSSGHVIKTRK